MLACPIFRSILRCVSAGVRTKYCTAPMKRSIWFGKRPAASQAKLGKISGPVRGNPGRLERDGSGGPS